MARPAFRAERQARIRKKQVATGQTSGPQAEGMGYGHRTINNTLTVLGIVLR